MSDLFPVRKGILELLLISLTHSSFWQIISDTYRPPALGS